MPTADQSAEPGDIEPVLMTLQFDTDHPDRLLALLARYVVVTRTHPGCRNVDLVASMTTAGRYLVIEKWSSGDHQRAHLDSDDLVALAQGCAGVLRAPPVIDLHEGISMHDLA